MTASNNWNELLDAALHNPVTLEGLLTEDEKFWIGDLDGGVRAWELLHVRFPRLAFINAIEIIRAYAIYRATHKA